MGRSVDSLVSTLGLPVSEVLAQIARLETDGVVVQSGGIVLRAHGPAEGTGVIRAVTRESEER